MMQELTINEVNAMLDAVGNQRNQFANEVVLLKGRLAAAMAKIAELEAKLKSPTEGGAEGADH